LKLRLFAPLYLVTFIYPLHNPFLKKNCNFVNLFCFASKKHFKISGMYDDSNIAINPLAVLKPVKPARQYTLGEYLEREERSKYLREYYNGSITKLPLAKGPHNIIVANMTAELSLSLRATGKDYTVLGSQQLVYLPELNFALYPDVLVVAEGLRYWDNHEVLLINPLLIVEVLSKSTRKYDRAEKYSYYKTLPSLKEYVLVDTDKCHVETRFREEPGLWRDTVFNDLSDTLVLKSVGCSIDMGLVYRKIEFKV